MSDSEHPSNFPSRPCPRWNDDWIASLYGELSDAESAALEAHLRDCTACASMLEQLDGSRRWLRESAPPVPEIPRVVVLQPRRSWRPLWAFAAGLLCAATLFVAGIATGQWLQPAGPAPASAVTASRDTDPSPTGPAPLRDPRGGHPVPSTIPAGMVSEAQLENRLDSVRRAIELECAGQFQVLLEELDAAGAELGSQINTNRRMLQYVQLTRNPNFSEQ